MPTVNEATEAIFQRWIDQWASTTSYAFEGESFDPPATDPWARVSVRHVESEQETLGPAGGRRFLRPGSAMVKLYGRNDRGRRELDLLGQQARAVFEGMSFSGVSFQAGTVREGTPEGELLLRVVEVPFFYEETK